MKLGLFCKFALLLSIRVEALEIIQPFPSNIFAISGTAANSTCIFRGDDGPPARAKFMRREPIPGLKWFDISDTEQVYQTNSTEGNVTTAVLHFKSITVQDDAERGRYECRATSATGQVVRHGFNIRVTPRADLPVPRITSSQKVSYGANVRLHCTLTHKGNKMTTPIMTMSFLKNGRPIKTTPDVEDPLILTDVHARDGGNYACQVMVRLQRLQEYNVTSATTAYLHVRVRFAFKNSRIGGYEGDTVFLVCSAEGYPMTVEWKKVGSENGTVIKPNEHFSMKGDCDYCRSVLVINNMTAEDSGNYSCSAVGNPGQQIFMVEVKTNATNVGARVVAPLCVTTILPVFLWTWWL